jgi:hypothetical protein
MHAKFWLENLMKTDHFRDLNTNNGIKLNGMLKKQNVEVWDGFHWMTTEYNGGLM